MNEYNRRADWAAYKHEDADTGRFYVALEVLGLSDGEPNLLERDPVLFRQV